MSLRVAIVTFERFNEIDSLLALHLFGRLTDQHVEAALAGPTSTLQSLYGVKVTDVRPLEWTAEADVVLLGSGMAVPAVSRDASLLARLRVDPARQLIGSQCSGALLLHALGLSQNAPVCADRLTRPRLIERGAQVIDAPLSVRGNVASAGGCLSAIYLSAWAITRRLGWDQAASAIERVAPVTEEADWVERAKRVVSRFEAL